jgi:iron complex outermembrane receptor protein
MQFLSKRIGLQLLALAAVLAPVLVLAAATGSISGTVQSQRDELVAEAEVTLVELKRKTKTDATGAFRFDDVPAGAYLIEVLSARHGSAVARAVVEADKETTVPVRIDLLVHHEDVVVSAGVSPQSITDTAQSIAVLDERQLIEKLAPTLGETLAQEPGIEQTQFAPGASRPVVRGLGGDRIRILQDGIGAGDASNVSPDHAVSVNTSTAERIEVVRGAATLLYGSNAVGGVVNVLDQRIPDHRTDELIGGDVYLRYGSVNELKDGAINVGGTSGALGWHGDYAKSDASDQRVGSDSDFPDDEIPNSDLETESWSVGGSWLGEDAYVGAAYNQFDTNYGSAVESEVRVDLEQKRWDLAGGVHAPFGPFRLLKARLGGTDYEHTELEGLEVGTVFLNESIEGRVELAHRQAGPWNGSFGIQSWHRDFQAIGAEAFVQPTTTFAQALFGYEELGTGAVRGQFGLRYEHQTVDSDDPALQDRDFNAGSGSAGVVWRKVDAYSVGATLSSSSRVPTAEELYSNGPHIATGSFEVGDDDLDLERSLGLDVALRKLDGGVRGEVNLFYSTFDDFIFERDTGTTFTTDEGDELPIVQFSTADAEFWGGETHVDFGLLHREPHHLDLELRADYVRSELTDLNQAVPLQPPLRGAIGLRYQGAALWASAEAFHAAEQDRFAPGDVETPDYTWLNASVGYRWVASRQVHDLVLRGTNLTDKLAFNSVSRYRFAVPLPGRDVSLSYRMQF